MLGSVALEVGIGLAITFLFFSLILMSAQEGIEALLKGRAKDLQKAIKLLLDDDKSGAMTKKLYEHPLVNPLFEGKYDAAKTRLTLSSGLPSYIPKGHFAAALADIVLGDLNGRNDTSPTPSAQVGRIFRLVNDSTQGSSQIALKGIEDWYDSAMERLSGRYKRKTQMSLFVVAFAVAAIANVNAISIGNDLATSQQLRNNMISIAPVVNSEAQAVISQISKVAVTDQTSIDAKHNAEKSAEKLSALVTANGLSVGRDFSKTGFVLFPDGLWIGLAGWLITALAGMLGAPFWFDVLAKFMNVRAALKPDSAANPAGTSSPASSTPASFPGATAGLVGNVEIPDSDDNEDCCFAHAGGVGSSNVITSDVQLPPAIGGISGLDNNS